MVALTRPQRTTVFFAVNAVRKSGRYIGIEPPHDTVICTTSIKGKEKMMVKESLSEVIRKAIEYARMVRRPISD